MGMSSWSVERVELLTALWSDGVPGGEIAKRLGVSRGALAGKRWALGLPPRDGAVARAAMVTNGRRTALLCGHGDRAALPETAAFRDAVSAAEEAIQPLAGSNPKPWELRRPGECAFPVAGCGSQVLSCCEPVERRSAYCHGHRELAAGRPWPPVEPADLAELRA